MAQHKKEKSETYAIFALEFIIENIKVDLIYIVRGSWLGTTEPAAAVAVDEEAGLAGVLEGEEVGVLLVFEVDFEDAVDVDAVEVAGDLTEAAPVASGEDTGGLALFDADFALLLLLLLDDDVFAAVVILSAKALAIWAATRAQSWCRAEGFAVCVSGF